jgi:ATP adenylyltransferase
VKHASEHEEEQCIFCAKPGEGPESDRENLILHRGERCFVILNKFPYTNGHLMVAPYEHVAAARSRGSRRDDGPASWVTVLRDAHRRVNVGFNQGRVAGAGFEHHIHMHVVPRWGGDTNFMPVLADTRVMPQSLEESYEALSGGLG